MAARPGTNLTPRPLHRVGNAGLGIAPAIATLVSLPEAWAEGWRVTAALLAVLAACGVLAVRGYRLRVRYEAHRLVVRGYLRTRTIPRESVTSVTDFPAVRWTTPSGRRRWTPIMAFAVSESGPESMRAHNLRNTARLRRWASRGGRGGGTS
ncbi:hypothetical protein [Streptomyces sp. NPDC056144]|uniref:hypothetical protein n=1 Tax=unclassified Streptomyces TaxID=2593676 RepID=UPI0035E2E22A